MWCGVLHTWRTHTCTICGMWERCDVWRVSAPALCANYLFITPRLHDTNTACSASSVQAHCILCGGPAAKCSSLGVRRQDFETGLEMWLSVCAGMGLGIWVFGMGSGEWAGVKQGEGGGEFLPALQTAINLVELHFHPPQWAKIRPNQFPIGRVMWFFLFLFFFFW